MTGPILLFGQRCVRFRVLRNPATCIRDATWFDPGHSHILGIESSVNVQQICMTVGILVYSYVACMSTLLDAPCSVAFESSHSLSVHVSRFVFDNVLSSHGDLILLPILCFTYIPATSPESYCFLTFGYEKVSFFLGVDLCVEKTHLQVPQGPALRVASATSSGDERRAPEGTLRARRHSENGQR